ncbi:MAG TPA: ATP-binding protein [Oscillospiraceae bacterium]|nr:ATP-binding protein [Oscillospiraceae bacterium]HPS34585.1 ATP-binding protein [Oscillospiraceae bacterium]
MQKVLSLVRKAVQEYDMIADGDKIAVGVSGGKDSMLTLTALNELRRFYPVKYDVVAVLIDLRFDGTDTDCTGIQTYCDSIGVPFHIKRTDIGQIVFDVRKEENPCSLCAKMRRGALHDFAKELGCNKIALGHHADDAAETFMMNVFIEGRIGCYSPVTYLSRKDITVIRPLSWMREWEVASAVKRLGIPVMKNKCPHDHEGQRKQMKSFLTELAKTRFPQAQERILGAMRRGHICGW